MNFRKTGHDGKQFTGYLRPESKPLNNCLQMNDGEADVFSQFDLFRQDIRRPLKRTVLASSRAAHEIPKSALNCFQSLDLQAFTHLGGPKRQFKETQQHSQNNQAHHVAEHHESRQPTSRGAARRRRPLRFRNQRGARALAQSREGNNGFRGFRRATAKPPQGLRGPKWRLRWADLGSWQCLGEVSDTYQAG